LILLFRRNIFFILYKRKNTVRGFTILITGTADRDKIFIFSIKNIFEKPIDSHTV